MGGLLCMSTQWKEGKALSGFTAPVRLPTAICVPSPPHRDGGATVRQADTAQLALAGTSTIHSVEAITLRDMLVAAGTMENGG
eukprot:6106935-Prymnesium_polylepis.1